MEDWAEIRRLHRSEGMPATVIGGRIGGDQSSTVLKERVRELRPVYLPPEPASRTAYAPGELAQCGVWFRPVDIEGSSDSSVVSCAGPGVHAALRAVLASIMRAR